MTTEPAVPDKSTLPTVPEGTTIPEESAIVEYSERTKEIVERDPTLSTAPDEVKNETMALIEAMTRRAQAEAKGAGDLARDTYLSAVRQAREAIEQNKVFEPERIEYSFKLLQMDAEKNWESIVKEVSTFGDRLADAAKAAWDALTAPRPDSKP